MTRTRVTDPALLAQLNAPQASDTEDDENLFQKVMRYGIKDPAIGLLNMGREFANLPNKLTRGYIPELSPSDYNFSEALGVEEPEAADKLIQGLAQYAPAMAIPGANLGRAGQALGRIPKIGRFASKAASEALPQALYSASQQAPEHAIKGAAEAGATMVPFSVLHELMQGTSPKMRNLAKALTALGAGYIGREGAKAAGFGETGADMAALISGALGGRGFSTNKERMNKLVEGVNPEITTPRLEAAKRLELEYLTPAEAGLSPWAAKRQGALGRTSEGGKMLIEKGKARQESERKAIERTMDLIYNEKMTPKMREAYQSLEGAHMPEEFAQQFGENEIIKRAQKMLENKPAYKESLKEYMPENEKLEGFDALKDIAKRVEAEKAGVKYEPPKTSVVYWDHVKRVLDDMVSTAERQGNKNEARILSDTRKQMRDQMDEAFPEYETARGLAERRITREGLEKVFDQKEINGTNFYRALASEKKFNELLKHLKNAPEAAQNLKDMRLLFKDLISPPTIKTAKGTEERGMNQARNPGDFLHHLLEHAFTKGGNDKAAIEFITSKNWQKQLEDINKISDKQMKMVALGLALSRGVAQAAGQSD